MDPNAAQIMADTYREGAGHSRTTYRAQLLLSLDMVGCLKHWTSAVELASAYRSAREASPNRTSPVMRRLREPFEEALKAAIRRDGVQITRRKKKSRVKLSKCPDVIKELSREWEKSVPNASEREAEFRSRVDYPYLLRSDRKKDVDFASRKQVEALVKAKGGPNTILEELRSGFREETPGWKAREESFSNRVGITKCPKNP